MVKQISEKSSFRGPFDKQHGKRDKILLKFQRHYLCDIYWSLWKQFSWKESLIVICKILGHFANTLNVGHISSLLNKDKLTQPIQMQLSQKQKDFSQFLASFSKSRLNFQHFQNKMTVISDVFPTLRTPKNMIRWMSEKSRFRRPFDKQDGKGTKHYWNLNNSTFSISIDHCEGNWVGKSFS